jgi:hypothetical protein
VACSCALHAQYATALFPLAAPPLLQPFSICSPQPPPVPPPTPLLHSLQCVLLSDRREKGPRRRGSSPSHHRCHGTGLLLPPPTSITSSSFVFPTHRPLYSPSQRRRRPHSISRQRERGDSVLPPCADVSCLPDTFRTPPS